MGERTKKRNVGRKTKTTLTATHDEKVVNKSAFHRRVAELLRQRYGLSEAQFASVREFVDATTEERVRMSRRIVINSIIDVTEEPDIRFAAVVDEAEALLKGYATLDEPHRADITRLLNHMTTYLRDPSRKRPLNSLMLAAPGAGKSHFIKRLAAAMKTDRVQAVTFNMATMQSADDMAQPIDELRNLKVNDQFPLLLLDEFDSDPSRYPTLLPLLWDGELHVGHRDLKLGKAIIVLAGSSPALPKTMNESATMHLDPEGTVDAAATGKLVDLLSRINGGVIEVPDLDLRTGDRDRRVDKVCITIALLRARFGDNLALVPRRLLRFIAHTTFRYGVRSIAHLIDIINSDAYEQGELKLEKAGLPFGSEEMLQRSSLRLHLLDRNRGFGIVDRWKEYAGDDALVNLKRDIPLGFLPLSNSINTP